jgi:phage N-6-adenine-methyltransferase
VSNLLTVDSDTGEVVAIDAEPREAYFVPDDAETMVAEANNNQRAAFGHHWRTAALVYAWTFDTGGGRPKKSAGNPTLFTLDAFAKLGIRGLRDRATVAKYRAAMMRAIDARLCSEPVRGRPVALPAIEFDQSAKNHLAQGTGENEWYTPQHIIERARAVMGAIDLDPASNPEANETIRADTYYTAEDDGLEQEWHGRIWLNPPYSRDLMPRFVRKLIEEHKAGRTAEAILVSHNNTETDWFQSLSVASTAVCFPDTRIKFYRGENVAAPVNGQVFFYLGNNPPAFIDQFRPLGIVMSCL